MLETAPPPVALRIVERPGLLERIIVVFIIVINQFGTPARWFAESTGSNSGPTSDPLLTAGTLVAVSALLVLLVGNGDAFVRALFADQVLLAFIMLLGLSPVWSDYFGESLNSAINLGLMFAFAMVMLVRYSVRDFIGIAAIANAIGIVLDAFWVAAMGSLGRTQAAWDGLGTNKNALGNHGVIAILIFLFAARLFPRRRFSLYTLTLVAFVLTVGSESKTALAAGLLTSLSMVVYVVFRAKRTMFGAVVLTMGAASATALAFATANIALIAGWLDKDVTLTGRTEFWPILIDSIRDRPLIGYGIDGYFRGPLSPSFELTAGDVFQATHAHNALLQVGLHAGVIGMVLFLFLNGRAVVRATDHARWVRGAEGLFPLVVLTLVIMLSITESGILGQRFGFALFVIAVVRARIGVEEAKKAGVVRLDHEAELASAALVPH